MKHRTSQILYAYWNDVRQGRLAPRRFDIEPSRISSVLAETLILERLDADNCRFRLAGTRIGEQLGAELRGTNFLEMWSNADRAMLQPMLAQMADQGGVGVIEIEATSSAGRPAMFEAVLLPLVHTRDIIDRFLGALSCINAPSWLGTERPTALSLADCHIVWPDGRPHAAASLIQHHHQLNQTPFDPVLSTARIVRQDRRQFRVLDGGRSGDVNGKR